MLVQMIKSKVGSIKSGWRSVFMIFTAAADDELESIVESAFENVEQGKNIPFLFLMCYYLFSMFFIFLLFSDTFNTNDICSYFGAL